VCNHLFVPIISFIWRNNPCHLPPNWRLCLGARIHKPSSNELCEHRHITLKSDVAWSQNVTLDYF
jgi:hypothetical protein